MSFRKILAATDFSPGSDHALQLAIRLAKADNAELVIAHAWYVPELSFAAGDWTLSPGAIERMVEDDDNALRAAVHEAAKLGAPRVIPRLVNGPPADTLVKLVRDDASIDLLVIGTQGRTALKRVLLGSVTEHLVRHAPCSVLVSRTRIEDAPFRTILVPVDFSDSSRRAMERAADLVAPGGGGIVLLHVVEPPVSRKEHVGDYIGGADASATRLLDQWATELRARTSAAVTTRSRIGRPGAEVLQVVDEAAYDLVVMGSHGRTGLSRVLLGSVAEKVVRHAWCPVLVSRQR